MSAGSDGIQAADAPAGRGVASARSFLAAPSSVSVVRAWTRAELAAQHAGPCAVEVAQLLISEVATNAVMHARGEWIVVRWSTDGQLRAEVHDQDPEHNPRLGHPGPSDAGGRGLILVQALASAWGTWTGSSGKCVWFHLPA
jgi:anti-sigma regulatory factor (Ser/Thr protein kinase)